MEWRWSSGDKMFKLLKFEFVIAGGGTVGHPPPTHNSSSSTSRPPYPAHHLHHASRPTPPVARPSCHAGDVALAKHIAYNIAFKLYTLVLFQLSHLSTPSSLLPHLYC